MPSSAQASISVTGTGEAPLMIQRTPEMSTSPAAARVCSMNCNIAGTSRPVVTRSASMCCHAFTGSNVRITIWVTPAKQAATAGVSAPTWNSGRATR